MKKHEIHIYSDYIETLISILDKHGISYILKNQYNNISVFDIYEKDIVNIYNILMYEMGNDGIDRVTKGFNDYGLQIDNFIGGFAALRGKLLN